MNKLSPTLQLCCELIRRASVTPRDEGCQVLLQDRLRGAGFTCTDLPFDEVSNFWAVHGNEGPLLVFAGHTDVVPTGPTADWDSPPFEPTVRDGMLFGRGAADMKGSLAAMVVACENFVSRYPDHPGRIAFLITSDEEGPAVNGTIKVMQWLQQRDESIDWCLVGEPSSSSRLGDVIKNGRRGSLGARLIVRGVQGHIAYPQLADNPVHKAMPALAELCSATWDSGNEFFPPTSFQVSNINSGTGATNVIPGQLEVLFNFRFSTEQTREQLKQRTEDILRAHGLDYDIEWQLSGNPFITAGGELVEAAVASIRELQQLEPELSTAGGTSDGRFIAPYGVQVLELGPINATIHKLNESVSCSDLDCLAELYQDILGRMLLRES